MAVQSAGILLYRLRPDGPEFWLGHMGGPYWARKQDHAWSIPKGEVLPGEDPFTAARREFAEEMGHPAPEADYAGLGSFRQSSGKVVTVFTAEAEFSPAAISSNTFQLEWPRGSGRFREFPEMDDAGWFGAAEARRLLVRGQQPVLAALLHRLGR